MYFNRDELELILNALLTLTEAQTKIATEHVIKSDFQSAENVMNKHLQRHELISKIEAHLKRR